MVRAGRELAELDKSMNNLMRVLERESDPEGQLYRRTKMRMSELEKEHAAVETRLQRHAAATPQLQEGNAGLLDHLPMIEVDLTCCPRTGYDGSWRRSG